MRKAKLLLTLAMAAAVVSTAAVSFAQWDTLSAQTSKTVTLANPITVTASQTDYTETRELDKVPTYTSTVTIGAANVSLPADKQATLTLVPTVTSDGTNVSDQVDVVIAQGNTTLANGVDSTVEASNEYTVTVTPHNDAAATLGGKPIVVEVTATLSAENKTA